MAELKWVKIKIDMFDNRKIKHLRHLPEGNNIVLIWVMLLTMAGRCNASGLIFLTENIPYTTKMLADELGFEENTVKLALEVLERFEMITTNEDNFLAIAGWEEHQSAEEMDKIREQNRQRQARFRERQKQLLLGNNNNENNGNVTLEITLHNGTEEEREEEREEEKRKREKKEIRINYQEIVDMYNDTCVSLRKVKTLSESRKASIKARLNKYSPEKIQEAFTKAEASDFLTGSNKRNWRADFDWIMKDSNIAKVLDGNYDNEESVQQVNTGVPVGAEQNDLDDVF